MKTMQKIDNNFINENVFPLTVIKGKMSDISGQHIYVKIHNSQNKSFNILFRIQPDMLHWVIF